MTKSEFNTKKAIIISTAVITPLLLITGGVLGLYFLAPGLITSLLSTLSTSLAVIVASVIAKAAPIIELISSKISLAAVTVYSILAPLIASAAAVLFTAAYTVGNTLLSLVGLNTSLSVNALAGIGAGIITTISSLLTAMLSGIVYGVAHSFSTKSTNKPQVKTLTEIPEVDTPKIGTTPSPVTLDNTSITTIETPKKSIQLGDARLAAAQAPIRRLSVISSTATKQPVIKDKKLSKLMTAVGSAQADVKKRETALMALELTRAKELEALAGVTQTFKNTEKLAHINFTIRASKPNLEKAKQLEQIAVAELKNYQAKQSAKEAKTSPAARHSV